MENKIKKIFKEPRRALMYLIDKKFFRILPDKQYLKIKYKIAYGRKLDLKNPKSYNEKLQWLKLYNRNPEYTSLVDKYEVKKYIKEKIGEEYIVPTIGIYDSFENIDFSKLPDKFVMKCTHDSGGIVVCKNKANLDMVKAKKTIKNSLSNNFYYHAREWPYKNIKPRIIIEKYLDIDEDMNCSYNESDSIINAEELQYVSGLLDYKFMCFDGKVKLMFLDIGVIGNGTGHAKEYYRNVYDRNFNLLEVIETRENYPKPINKPKNFDKMVEIAETLSKGISHVRVDLYNVNGRIYFGEMTFFHGSGLSNYFVPENWNDKLGSYIDLSKAEFVPKEKIKSDIV